MEKPDYQFIAVIKGPQYILGDNGCIVETLEFSQQELEEEREEGESPDDYLDYFLEEYINEWEQKHCTVQIFTPEQWKFLASMVSAGS